jgi:hypothetical protein
MQAPTTHRRTGFMLMRKTTRCGRYRRGATFSRPSTWPSQLHNCIPFLPTRALAIDLTAFGGSRSECQQILGSTTGLTIVRSMSDVPEGPNWWLATDRRWYPPERHPAYRPPAAPESPATAPPPVTPPTWAADPYGRREWRFWDGEAWTAAVVDGGAPGVDAPG